MGVGLFRCECRWRDDSHTAGDSASGIHLQHDDGQTIRLVSRGLNERI